MSKPNLPPLPAVPWHQFGGVCANSVAAEAIKNYATAYAEEAVRQALAAQVPVAWLIDWPDEPELGHYLSESPADNGRSRPLILADSASQASEAARDAMFWYRPRSDGGYEGPIHNDRIEYVRKLSGAWVPLYPGVRDWSAILPKPHTDMRYHGEFVRGWNQCLQQVHAALASSETRDG